MTQKIAVNQSTMLSQFDKLCELMTEKYSVGTDYNHPVTQITHYTTGQLKYILQQYCFLAKELVSYSEAVQQEALKTGWLEIAEKLQQTIVEELGSETQGISHYDLLANGFESIGVPLKGSVASAVTALFLDGMRSVFNQQKEVSYLLGAAYALEASAVTELSVVYQLVKSLGMSPELEHFFNAHMSEWEPLHQEMLRSSLSKYPINSIVFENGFCAVLGLLDEWWTQLINEALSVA